MCAEDLKKRLEDFAKKANLSCKENSYGQGEVALGVGKLDGSETVASVSLQATPKDGCTAEALYEVHFLLLKAATDTNVPIGIELIRNGTRTIKNGLDSDPLLDPVWETKYPEVLTRQSLRLTCDQSSLSRPNQCSSVILTYSKKKEGLTCVSLEQEIRSNISGDDVATVQVAGKKSGTTIKKRVDVSGGKLRKVFLMFLDLALNQSEKLSAKSPIEDSAQRQISCISQFLNP